MIDPFFTKHGGKLEPNTYKRGSQRIDFYVCNPHIEEFIIFCGINPFDVFTSSSHRVIYLDVNILLYLKDSFTTPSTPDSRILVSTNP